MGRILLVWQLGGNLGHITPLRALGKALRKRGHHVTFALENTSVAAQALTRDGFPFVQAPALRSTAPDLPREPASYPEMLFHCGFADPDALTGSVRAWRALYREREPDLILFDHAPTALLAARGTDIPRVAFGTGFASPPRVSPMPSIRPWQDIPGERLEASEQRALETANAALRSVGVRPIDVFHELFDVEENILATLPELDHYGARPGARYWGPLYESEDGDVPRWPQGEGAKVFVYLRPTSPGFRQFVDVLRKAKLRTLWFAPGLPLEVAQRLQTSSLAFAPRPLKMSKVIATANAAIHGAGHGTTAAMFLGGIPMVLVPRNAEQVLLARCIAILRAGVVVTPQKMRDGLGSLSTHSVDHKLHLSKSKIPAASYETYEQRNRVELIVDRVENLSGTITGRDKSACAALVEAE